MASKKKNDSGPAARKPKAPKRYEDSDELFRDLGAWAWETRGSSDPTVRDAQRTAYPLAATARNEAKEIREAMAVLARIETALAPVNGQPESVHWRGEISRRAAELTEAVRRQREYLAPRHTPARRGREGTGPLAALLVRLTERDYPGTVYDAERVTMLAAAVVMADLVSADQMRSLVRQARRGRPTLADGIEHVRGLVRDALRRTRKPRGPRLHVTGK